MTTPQPSHVVREVRRHVSGIPLTAIEDACQDAWLAFIQRGLDLDEKQTFWYLVRAAVRGCWKAYRRQLRTGHQLSESEPDRHDVVTTVLARDRLRLLGPTGRQRRVLWLNAAGYSYSDISLITGDSARTVERQLLRGRTALVA